jgi:hypothetical protein
MLRLRAVVSGAAGVVLHRRLLLLRLRLRDCTAQTPNRLARQVPLKVEAGRIDTEAPE